MNSLSSVGVTRAPVRVYGGLSLDVTVGVVYSVKVTTDVGVEGISGTVTVGTILAIVGPSTTGSGQPESKKTVGPLVPVVKPTDSELSKRLQAPPVAISMEKLWQPAAASHCAWQPRKVLSATVANELMGEASFAP